MSKLRGKQVKIMPNSVWHLKGEANSNKAFILTGGEEGVTLQDSYGVVIYCLFNEVRYLNNREVKP